MTAIMLLENDVLMDQFTEEKIRSPKVLEMISRILISHDPALDGHGQVEGNPVEIELKDGTVLQAWGRVRGGSERPIPAEEVISEFRKVTARQIHGSRQGEIIASCNTLETLPDADALLSLLPA